MGLSLLTSAYVMALAWRRRRAPGALAMMALTSATFVWTFGFLVEANSTTLDRQLLFNNIGYIGSMSVPVAWFAFALQYTRGNRVLNARKVLLLSLLPLATVVLVWTNNWHHLMWSDEHLATSGPFTVTVKTYGTFFWIAYAYNYVLVFAGAAILLRRLFVGIRLYTLQAWSLVIAVVIPLAWNAIYVFHLLPIPRKDLTPAMFAVSGMAIASGVLGFRLFQSVPFAHRFLVQQLKDGVLAFDSHGYLLHANPAAMKMLGLGAGSIGNVIDSPPPSFRAFLPPSREGFADATADVAGEVRSYELETTFMHDDRNQQGWLVVIRDVTEKRAIQQQMQDQDRLASIGMLTSGVAHELNNPLATIVGYSELLSKRELPADVKEDLSVIFDEAYRAAGIVENLLTFARQKPAESQAVCEINTIVKKALALRQYEQEKNHVKTVQRLSPGPLQVLANEPRLRQVFVNLIVNAEFFMTEAHGTGTLTVTTGKKGDSVFASFEDDGPGIPKENMKYLFTPFFTTKKVVKGTGLGLSISYGIVTEHGGRLSAESVPGQGATFTVELPAYVHPAGPGVESA